MSSEKGWIGYFVICFFALIAGCVAFIWFFDFTTFLFCFVIFIALCAIALEGRG